MPITFEGLKNNNPWITRRISLKGIIAWISHAKGDA
jgi:hypothetical protein